MGDFKNGTKIRESLGQYVFSIPAKSGGVAQILCLGWYLPRARKIKYRIAMVLASTHKGTPITITAEQAWEGKLRRAGMREHIHAVGKKYRRQYTAGMWPEYKNYLAHCNSRRRTDFVETNCSECKASYCSVER
jgi:hypothetical protein